ncbi:RluA family pseudouridine synthase [Desulfonema ishimotonii]|uniref:RluA family pseudouridine synthase n=1 Tax=Desulfonema ishimotonii TaxID=45657 RepID=UPI001AA0785C|nr:RluA family pseudouridine synthase [Desulfonema ishimotonii]
MDNFFAITVSRTSSGQRMDALVAGHLPDVSRAFVTTLIRSGSIRVGGQVRKPGYRLKTGDQITGSVPRPVAVSYEPEPIPLDFLYEDADLVVINKRPGLVVHPAPGHYAGTLVNALLYHCPDIKGIGGELRPGIVHRLDKETSGVLIIAKTAPALAHLAHQFKSRTVRKTYLALVHGETKQDSDRITLPIGRHPVDRKKMSVVSRHGREAETLWSVCRRFRETTLLEVNLKTGRTHQIRVHCAAIRHPLVGDPVYCSGKIAKNHTGPVLQRISSARRQMLHAWKIRFIHPRSGHEMAFEAPPYPDMENVINALEKLSKGE